MKLPKLYRAVDISISFNYPENLSTSFRFSDTKYKCRRVPLGSTWFWQMVGPHEKTFGSFIDQRILILLGPYVTVTYTNPIVAMRLMGYKHDHIVQQHGNTVYIDGEPSILDLEEAHEICEGGSAPCTSCGKTYEIEVDLWDHDPDMHFCGSQWCMP